MNLELIPERVLSKFEVRPSGCWEWTGAVTWSGYGQIKSGAKIVYAHRHMYELLVGPIPDGLQIDHLCRNRVCVNPSHLEPVTNRENTIRGEGPTAKNSRKTHCKRGHELSGSNVYTKLSQPGRECKACRAIWARGYYAKKKNA